MPIKIFSVKEKNEFVKRLNSQFGIKKLSGFLIQTGGERIFLYQGMLSPAEIVELERTIPIERIGIYFAKETPNGIRLSIDGIHLVQNQITKNIFILEDKDKFEEWISGSELQIKTGNNEFLIMKYQNDFIGTGKASAEKISNFIPKNRRLKLKN